MVDVSLIRWLATDITGGRTIWDDNTGKVVGKYAVVNRNLGNLGIK